MTTFIAWVLILTAEGAKTGGPTIIDNIASRENCEALAATLQGDTMGRAQDYPGFRLTARCVAVRKVKP